MIARTFHHHAVVQYIAMLVAYAIHCADKHAIRNGVSSLDGLPRVILALAKLDLLAWMPADRSGEEQRLGTLQRCDASSFRIPLVPANERADGASGGLLRQEPKVPGGEIELLVVERVIGDMHLAIDRR